MAQGGVRTFPASDEVPHQPEDHPLWQESVFFTWADPDQGVYGYHRIGQEVNANGGAGLVTTWNGIAVADGLRWRRYVLQELRPADRGSDTFAVGEGFRFTHDGGRARWRIEEGDCSLDLSTTDFTPRFDLYRDGGTVVTDFAAGHIEMGGRVSGSVRLGDRHFDVDGLAYRDHSWGKRDRSTMLSHRWIAGTVGPGLTFNATAWHGADGTLRTYGIVCRDGVIAYATDVDIVVFSEIDAISHRGGVLRMVLEDGSRVELTARLVDAFLTKHHNTAVIDSVCDVEWEGQRGFCDFEISTNPRGGTGPVRGLVRAADQDGLSRRPYQLVHDASGGGVPRVSV